MKLLRDGFNGKAALQAVDLSEPLSIKQTIVSVIVPIYNVAPYLEKCLDSLVKQTYSNLQIILVDDGSTDGSAQICDRYAKADERLLVIHKQNGGLSSAREAGVAAVTGKYAMFVDADDWIDFNTIEECMNSIQISGAECVLFSYVKEYPEKSIVVPVMDKERLFTGDDAKNKVYRRLYGPLGAELKHPERLSNLETCCMKLYKTELVKKGRYFDTKEVGSSEDGLFNMYALYSCNRFLYINKPFYHYRKGVQSLTGCYRPNLANQWKHLFEIIEDIIKEKKLGTEYGEALQNRIACSIISIGLNEIAEGNWRQQCERIRQYMQRDYIRQAYVQLPLMNMPVIWKFFFGCVKTRMTVLVCLQLRVMNWLRRIK